MEHDIKLTIDSVTKGLDLTSQNGQKAWKVTEVPRSVEATMPLQKHNPLIDLKFEQTDWSGGFGQGIYKDNNRYALGQSIDTLSYPGEIILGPAINATTIAGGGNMGANPVSVVYFPATSKLYCATGAKVYSWNTSTAVWDEEEDFTAIGTISQIFVHNAVLYVAMGTSVDYYYSTDGSAYTASTLTDDKANGFFVAPSGDGTTQNLWKWLNPNTVSSTTNGQNGGVQWTAYTVGDTSTNITNLMLLGNKLLIGKTDNLYYLDSDGKTQELMTDLKQNANTNNFKYAVNWQSSLYHSLNQARVGEITSYNATSLMGPFYDIEGIVKLGEVVGMASDNDYLYVVIDEGTNSVIYKGREVREGNELRWQWCPWVFLGTNVCAIAYICELSSDSLKLWFGYGTALNYVILSYKPLADDTYTFAASGNIETGWWDAGYAAWTKFIQSVTVEPRSIDNDDGTGGKLSTNIKITASYEKDEAGEYTALTAYTADAAPTKKYITGGTSYNKIRFKIALDSNDSSITPRVKFFGANGQLRPENTKLYDFTVHCGDTQGGLSKTIRDFLNTGRTSTSLITINDRFGTDHKIIFIPGYPEEVEVYDEKSRQSSVGMHVLAIGVDDGS